MSRRECALAVIGPSKRNAFQPLFLFSSTPISLFLRVFSPHLFFLLFNCVSSRYAIQIPLPPKIDPSVTMMTVEEKPDVTYDDVGGAKDAIQQLREVVEIPLLHPERFVELGTHFISTRLSGASRTAFLFAPHFSRILSIRYRSPEGGPALRSSRNGKDALCKSRGESDGRNVHSSHWK